MEAGTSSQREIPIYGPLLNGAAALLSPAGALSLALPTALAYALAGPIPGALSLVATGALAFPYLEPRLQRLRAYLRLARALHRPPAGPVLYNPTPEAVVGFGPGGGWLFLVVPGPDPDPEEAAAALGLAEQAQHEAGVPVTPALYALRPGGAYPGAVPLVSPEAAATLVRRPGPHDPFSPAARLARAWGLPQTDAIPLRRRLPPRP